MTDTQLIAISALLCITATLAEKVILYDAQTESDFCTWKIQQLLGNGTFRQSMANPGTCNKVCAAQNTQWFVSSAAVKVDMANMLTISLTVDLDYRSRNPTLTLLAAQTMSGKPQQYQYNYKLAEISLSQYQTTVTGVVTRDKKYLNIGLSLPDLDARQPPECVTIARATVYYYKCPSRKANMAIFPDVIAPSGDIDNREKGQCMPNTVPIGSSGVWMYCDKTGSVDKIYGCECRAGFERASNSCTVCGDGMYKDKPGNHKCSKCGKGSVSSRDGTSCPCLTGSREAIGSNTYSTDCKSIGHQNIVIILGSALGVVVLVAAGLFTYIRLKLKGRNAPEQRPLLNQGGQEPQPGRPQPMENPAHNDDNVENNGNV